MGLFSTQKTSNPLILIQQFCRFRTFESLRKLVEIKRKLISLQKASETLHFRCTKSCVSKSLFSTLEIVFFFGYMRVFENCLNSRKFLLARIFFRRICFLMCIKIGRLQMGGYKIHGQPDLDPDKRDAIMKKIVRI